MGKESKDLARRLKALMQEQGWSAAELARQSGVSVASLSRILAGSVNPSFSNMQRIAQALEVGLDNLVADTATTVSRSARVAPPASQASMFDLNIAATFSLVETDKTPKEAGQLLASAARGTWVSTWTEDYVAERTRHPELLDTRQVGTKRIEVDLLFPHEMIEENSMTGLLSVTSAAMTGTEARMLDIRIPEVLLRTFRGPTLGARGIRDMANKFGRPLLSATMRPMMGLSPRQYGRAIFEALKGGVDLTCDPTLMHSIPGNGWRERFRFAAEAVHSAANDTSEFKSHVANITAGCVEDMLERAQCAKELDLTFIMVDSAAVGWSALQSVARWCHNNEMALCAMGGRALAGKIMAEQLEAKLLRVVGCDVASMGSPLRGNVSQRRFSMGTVMSMRDERVERAAENGLLFKQPFGGMESCLPAVGGGHNPWHFPRLIDALGDDIIIQCGGSVMGHPWGSAAGATANRVAVEALVQARGEGHTLNVDGRNILQRAMKYSPELKAALEFWQEGSFLFGVIPGDNKGPLEGKVEQTLGHGRRPDLHTVKNEEDDDE
jgi:ribulose-bisphosphate carboxylase large chain